MQMRIILAYRRGSALTHGAGVYLTQPHDLWGPTLSVLYINSELVSCIRHLTVFFLRAFMRRRVVTGG